MPERNSSLSVPGHSSWPDFAGKKRFNVSMPPAQMLLFPDPRPLVERLGRDFFPGLPATPGVYLMRDAAGTTLYVGKARNLRQRLGSYRVANPDRLRPRHLRLLRAVARIDFEECEDEAAALATEARLLQSLRPKFNRAGTWPRAPRLVGWRMAGQVLELCELPEPREAWRTMGPLHGAWRLRDALSRLIWRVANPESTLAQRPHSWITSGPGACRRIACGAAATDAERMLDRLCGGDVMAFCAWARQAGSAALFDLALIEEDISLLGNHPIWRNRKMIETPEAEGIGVDYAARSR